MCALPTEVAIKLLGSYPTTLLRRTSSQVYFTDFANISRISIFQNIYSVSFCTCGFQEKTTEKSTVESIVFKVTVLHYNRKFT